jgi:hypothetical protein
MVVPTIRSGKSSRLALAPTNRPRPSRFSRPSSFERPPVVLEWGSWMLRVGTTEEHLPKHMVPYELPDKLPQTAEEWYYTIIPLVNQCWDRLLLSNNTSRRVVVLHPPMMPRAWEAALTQAMWNLGVPALVFLSILDTPPLALEWQRGMIVHVGKTEAHCLAHADGHALQNTLQIVACGYQAAVSDASKVEPSWTSQMDQVWLNEKNPNSLLLAIAKGLEACPTQVRKDIAENIVFCGETIMIVPELPSKVCHRLKNILQGDALELEHASELTLLPLEWKKLQPLQPTPRTTGPYRADMVSWIGASLWATVWNRHDEDDQHVPWTYAPTADEVVVS